jgi:Na+/H+ antiporter NhaD/arsenite permease-like protein
VAPAGETKSANVIVVGIAEKSGNPIFYKKFILYGMPFMIRTVIISMLYVWLRYYIL